jgi:peptide/nickel transport system permease protein
MGGTQLGIAIPNFWFAMLLVLVFAVNAALVLRRRLSRLGGRLLAAIKALTLPAIALACRRPRSSPASCARRCSRRWEDYIRTARAKGLSRGQAVAPRAAQRADPGADHHRACSFPSCWRARSSSRTCSSCPASGG